MLKSLLPRGRALTREVGSWIDQLLYSYAEEFARIDERADDFIEETDPATTTELIAEHEADYNIEWNGLDGINARREVVVAKLVARGQQDKSYFVQVADKIMYLVVIEEFRPCWAGVAVAGDPCGDQVNIFFWKVQADVNKQKGAFACDFYDAEFDGVSILDIRYVARLTRSLDTLISQINSIKPGHSTALYDFYNVGFSRAFHWGFDAMPINDGTIPIEECTSEFSSAFTAVGNYDGTYLTGAFNGGFCLSFDRYNGGEFESTAFDTTFRRPV
jgi:uncharacterized protein YmfQ (DUF2313 family)